MFISSRTRAAAGNGTSRENAAVTAHTASSWNVHPIVWSRIARKAAPGARSTARPWRAMTSRRRSVRCPCVSVRCARRAERIASARRPSPTRPRITRPVTAQCGSFAVANT